MIARDQKYFAFISYSHRDKRWGAWLHRSLETFRVPRGLLGKTGRDGQLPKRLFPVFRDREELPGAANLGDNINDALRRSSFLIVICSPNSAVSQWVNEEVRYFKALGREDRVLCLIVDGEPNATDKPGCGRLECFPSATRFRVGPDGNLTSERTEPIAPDARPEGDGRRNAKLKLIAGILGVNYDDLKQRDARRKRFQALRLVILGTLLLGGFRFFQERERQALLRQEAVRARIAASEREFERAERLADEKPREALVWLAAALREDPSNGWAARRLVSLLSQKSYPMFLGHIAEAPSRVLEFLVSPDRTFFVAVDEKYQVRSYDIASGKLIGQVITLPISENAAAPGLALPDPVRSWAFSADGSRLAIISEEPIIGRDGRLLRGLASGRKWFTIVEPRTGKSMRASEPTDAETVGAGRDVFLVAGSDKLQLWDAGTGEPRSASFAVAGILRAAVLTSDGTRIFTGTAEGEIARRDAGTGAVVGEPLRQQGAITTIALDKEGRRFAAGAESGTVAIWNLAEPPSLVARLSIGDKPIAGLLFSPDGTRLAVLSRQNHGTTLWNTLSGERIAGPFASGGDWATFSFSSSGEDLLLLARGGAARLIDAKTGTLRGESIEVDNGIEQAEWSLGTGRVLTLVRNRTLLAWDVRPHAMRPLRLESAGGIRSFSISLDGKCIVTGGADGIARVWDPVLGTPTLSVPVPGGEIQWVEYIDDSGDREEPAEGRQHEIFRTHTAEGAISWDAETGERLGSGTESAVSHIDLAEAWSRPSTDGRLRLSAGSNNIIRIVDERTGVQVGPDIVLGGAAVDGRFSPDATRIAVACADGVAQVWEIQTGKPIGQPMVHRAKVTDVQFSPDGLQVATASADRTARLWDAATGRPLCEPFPHDAPVAKVQFVAPAAHPLPDQDERMVEKQSLPGAESIATLSGGTVYIWTLPRPLPLPAPAWLPDLAEAIATRTINAGREIVPFPGDIGEALLAIRRQTIAPENQTASPWQQWAAWFFSDPDEKPLSPWRALTGP